MKFTGYVLTGGKSSRMGTDKAFLEIAGKTFIENAVEILQPNCEQVKIVLNSGQKHFIEKLPSGVSYVFDIYENRGAPGGIHVALKDCKTEFAVILAVDLPFVTSKTIEILTKIALSENRAAVVPLQNDGVKQPLCAVYCAEECLPIIEDLIKKEKSVSVRDFLHLISPVYVEQNEFSGGENLFANINLPSEYQNIN